MKVSIKNGIITFDPNAPDPEPLVWTGPNPDCTCSSINIEQRECQGFDSCKCGKTIFGQ